MSSVSHTLSRELRCGAIFIFGGTVPDIQLPTFVGEDFNNEWRPDLSNDDYHADKTAGSSTSLKKLIEKSALTYKAHATGEIEWKPTLDMRLGSLLHLALLEPWLFKRHCMIMPKFVGKAQKGHDSETCKEAKAMKQEWLKSIDPNAIVVTEAEMKSIHGMIKSVKSHSQAAKILEHGRAEISGYFRDPETGIKCKIRPDLFLEEGMILLDVKTCEDCTEEAFSRTINTYRYDIQMAMYSAGIEQITGKPVDFHMWLAIEKKPPYECALWRCKPDTMDMGIRDYRKAMSKLKVCLETDQFDPYQTEMGDIGHPKWALKNGVCNEY